MLGFTNVSNSLSNLFQSLFNLFWTCISNKMVLLCFLVQFNRTKSVAFLVFCDFLAFWSGLILNCLHMLCLSLPLWFILKRLCKILVETNLILSYLRCHLRSFQHVILFSHVVHHLLATVLCCFNSKFFIYMRPIFESLAQPFWFNEAFIQLRRQRPEHA